jgi:hypothetical protein
VLFRPVFENGGFVSDVKGDSMLAVWADDFPARELRARVCRACLSIADAAARFDASLPGRGFVTRIGAYFGPLALASVGAFSHYEYRAVGDTVNTSSRLQDLNKELGTRVLVSASLAEGLGEFLFRDLGMFELRGNQAGRTSSSCSLARSRDARERACATNFRRARRVQYGHGPRPPPAADLCALSGTASRFYLQRCGKPTAAIPAVTRRLYRSLRVLNLRVNLIGGSPCGRRVAELAVVLALSADAGEARRRDRGVVLTSPRLPPAQCVRTVEGELQVITA